MNTTVVFVPPEATDPDGDQIAMTINLGPAMVFTKVQGNQLVFSPSATSVGTYTIKITLSDNNKYPLYKEYSLSLYVVSPTSKTNSTTSSSSSS